MEVIVVTSKALPSVHVIVVESDEEFWTVTPIVETSTLAFGIRNRCEVSGRPHGVYRKLKISRIALRDMASSGKIPGITKSSW